MKNSGAASGTKDGAEEKTSTDSERIKEVNDEVESDSPKGGIPWNIALVV